MHELSVTQSVVDACSERAGDARVLRVTLEIGALSCVMPESMRFCFDVVAAETPLQDAELEIRIIPGHSRCRACGASVTMHSLFSRCACGSDDLEPPIGGDLLNIKSMEIEEAA